MMLTSIVVLVARDQEGLEAWQAQLEEVMTAAGLAFEVVYAISDRAVAALAMIERRRALGRPLSEVVLAHWFNDAAAVQRALERAQGGRVLIVPGGGDVATAELPRLIAALDGADLVLAERIGVAPAALADRVARRRFGLPLADPGCRTRAWRRAALEPIGDRSVPYGLLPLAAAWEGRRIDTVAVRPAAAGAGRRHLPGGVGTAAGIVALHLLLSFARRPLQLFGTVGALAIILGLAITLPPVAERLIAGEALAARVTLIPGLLLIALGIQCAALGLIAELLVFARNHTLREHAVDRLVE
jgi:hypothetical protein